MANAKNKLSKVIREIVQQEVEKQLVEIFGNKNKNNAQDAQNEMMESYGATQTNYTKNSSLNAALNETANEDYKTVKSFDSGDARAGFASMQDMMGGGKPTVQQMVPRDMQGRDIDPAVGKALTRDYSELVKAMSKKKK